MQVKFVCPGRGLHGPWNTIVTDADADDVNDTDADGVYDQTDNANDIDADDGDADDVDVDSKGRMTIAVLKIRQSW